MPKSSMIVRMEGGKVLNRDKVAAFFAALPDGANYLEADNSKKRTNPMNRYLHGVLIPEFRKALNGVGYNEVKTDEQAKLVLKAMFLTRKIVNEETGEVIEYVEDTRNLSTVEMGQLFEDVAQFAAEHLGYYIGLPNEQMTIDYYAAVATYDRDFQTTIIEKA